jgi:hypothetical protein
LLIQEIVRLMPKLIEMGQILLVIALAE